MFLRLSRTGWDQFLCNPPNKNTNSLAILGYFNVYGREDVKWERVLISGHSQGGSHAAFLASELPLRKLVLLSAPQHIHRPEVSFLTRIKLSTKDFVALSHRGEDGISSIKAGLRALDDTEELVEIDESFDYSELKGKRFFLSSIVPKISSVPRKEHLSTALDGVASSSYEKIWSCLLETE